jgi:Smr domain-containing protein
MPTVWWILGTVLLGLAVAWLGKRWLPESHASRRPIAPPTDPPADVAIDLEIGDELDLHGVPPRQVAELVDAFIEVGLERRRRTLRIVHGRGIRGCATFATRRRRAAGAPP